MLAPPLPPKGLQQYSLKGTRVLADFDHFPFISIRTYGVVDGDTLRLLYCLRDPCGYWAFDRGLKTWVIWDHEFSEIPDAEGRKAITEVSNAGDRMEGTLNISHIVKKPIVRGVINAITWVTGNQLKLELTKTFPHAIRVARQGYKASGLKPPPIPDDYTLRDWSEDFPTQYVTMDDVWWTVNNRGQQLARPG